MSRDALRAHVVTSLIFSLALGAIALVWAFPRFFLFLLLTALAAAAYMRLYVWVEARLEAFEEVEEPVKVHRPRRRRKKRAAASPAVVVPAEPVVAPVVPVPATPITAVKSS